MPDNLRPKPEETRELKIERLKITGVDKQKLKSPVPSLHVKVNIDDQRKKELIDEAWEEFEAIKEERDKEKIDKKHEALERQYAGCLPEDANRQFNVHRHITKIKVNGVTLAAMQAFFDNDPIYTVTPRPEFARDYDGIDTCEKQSDFLDYKIDETIPLRAPMGKTVKSATMKGIGILKVYPHVERVPYTRVEYYRGDEEGLNDFLTNYPEAETEHKSIVDTLKSGTTVKLDVTYYEVEYNDPKPTAVDTRNFYARLSCDGYHGLCRTRLTIERLQYTGWELRKMQEKGDFEDVDRLFMEKSQDVGGTAPADRKFIKNYLTEKYDILEMVFECHVHEDDKKTTKIVMWVSEERKIPLMFIYYPLHTVRCYYIPFYVNEGDTFYREGVAEDLTDSNIVHDILLNFSLEAVYARNTVTPIVEKNSMIEAQFLEKRWVHGVPLVKDRGESVDFLQRYINQFDTNSVLALDQLMSKDDDEVSRYSSLMTGRESAIDPQAPAAKTIALLERSGVNVRAYIENMAPSFNECGAIFLQIYHQISQDGRGYRKNNVSLIGEGSPFGTITRAEMIARTKIQTMAAAYSFDKMNEKKEDIALMQLIRREKLIDQNPNAVYYLLKNIIRNWSPKWKNVVNKVLLSEKEFEKYLMTVAIQTLNQYIVAQQEAAKQMGIDPQLSIAQFLPMLKEALRLAASYPTEEEVKAKEKQMKEVEKQNKLG